MLLWISAAVLLYILITTRTKQVSGTAGVKGFSVIAATLIFAVLVLDVSNSFYTINTYKLSKKFYTHLRDVLYVGAAPPELKYLYPWTDILFQRREILKKYDLSV